MPQWKYFTEKELADTRTGECHMDADFMVKLIKLRELYGKPMRITSGYRSKETNLAVNGAENSPHMYGKAVDVYVSGVDALNLLVLAVDVGFTGIGVSQKGTSRFIHIDTMENSPTQPRPTIWSY
ncbi:Peptidase M15A, C-terminal [uncultured Caudovirales phage]|uniref:Murein endopeptidase K n=1 Tax=uncultured Caudovirales phage TaxID=2100421 RepID=A0A6J5S922_9CAUD|nr:Peptidase M15A, C-terminal [uncultured Caudovirales phage]CAB4168416.1 Peptidase M15A, C-terminal [uncultured Caudovirales phage]CAB4196401.1 Peptidase M15A, C-terminal [uncultured Caudovirales phage]CAB4205374.1 Peptidase M15A, C-terminal [uncultured Caudovirales phage]